MNLRLAAIIILLNIISVTALSWRTSDLNKKISTQSKNKTLSTAETILTFKDFQITSIKDKEVQLKAITDNAGVKQVTDIRVNIEGESLSFEIVVLPNYRNVELKYSGKVKIR